MKKSFAQSTVFKAPQLENVTTCRDKSKGDCNSAVGNRYPTWLDPLRPVNDIDLAFQRSMEGGQVLPFNSQTSRRWMSVSTAVFTGCLNSRLASAKARGASHFESTLADLAETLPFLAPETISHGLFNFQNFAADLVQKITRMSVEESGKLRVEFENNSVNQTELPIDRVVRVSDACEYGPEAAAVLFFMATRSWAAGEWIDIIDWRACAHELPPELRLLIKRRVVKRHRTNLNLVRLADLSRMHLPEVCWFALKRYGRSFQPPQLIGPAYGENPNNYVHTIR